ncbi:MAG: T9SS type A sorting domain-containing protein [Bacteroidota bacterium]
MKTYSSLNSFLSFCLFTFCLSQAQAQIYPSSISFQSQLHIDTFPPYTQINGSVLFQGLDITNVDSLYRIEVIQGDLNFSTLNALESVDGLAGLTSVGGDFWLNVPNSNPPNTVLTNVDSLSNLTSVGGTFAIGYYDALTHVDGLSSLSKVNENLFIGGASLQNVDGLLNLDSVGSVLGIGGSPLLTNLDGLASLVYAGLSLHIVDNAQLVQVNGLSSLSFCGTQLLIQDNPNLVNLDGLSSLVSVGTTASSSSVGGLIIRNNASLPSLNGLDNLSDIGTNIWIKDNPLLVEIDALSKIDSVPGAIILDNNMALHDVYGLRNVSFIGAGADIEDNPMLSDCCGLYTYVNHIGVATASTEIINNGAGCTAADIQANGPCEEEIEHFLTGYSFMDQQDNCVADSQDLPFAYRIVQIEPGPYYGASNADGIYQISVDTGTYEVRILTGNPQWESCDNSYSATVNASDTVVSVADIGIQVDNCPDLSLDFYGLWNRRCFPGSITLQYCNQGLTAATQTSLRMAFPEYVQLVSATESYTYLADSTVVFDLGTLDPFACNSIVLQTEVVCGPIEILGLSQCIEAWLLSPDLCSPPSIPSWSGASLSIQAGCVGKRNQFVVINEGTGDMMDSTTYRIYADTLLVQIGNLILDSGDSLLIDIPGNGQMFRLEVDQVPNHPMNLMVSAAIEGCVAILSDTTSRGMINRYSAPMPEPEPTYVVACLEIIGSYDPNDKQVLPKGIGETGQTRPGTRLQYVINFQNTGTDTAFKVVLTDTLSTNLDVQSFRIETSSHPYRLEVEGLGQPVLHFHFDNILLPDSNVNEPASHGYIQFSIDHDPSIPLGTEIENFADIYFDFNPPIRTNTVLNTLSDFQPEAIGSVEGIGLTYLADSTTTGINEAAHFIFHLFPNPAKHTVQISGSTESRGQLHIEWLDLHGRLLKKSIVPVSSREFSLEEKVPDLPAGLYFIRLDQQFIQKIVIY